MRQVLVSIQNRETALFRRGNYGTITTQPVKISTAPKPIDDIIAGPPSQSETGFGGGTLHGLYVIDAKGSALDHVSYLDAQREHKMRRSNACITLSYAIGVASGVCIGLPICLPNAAPVVTYTLMATGLACAFVPGSATAIGAGFCARQATSMGEVIEQFNVIQVGDALPRVEDETIRLTSEDLLHI